MKNVQNVLGILLKTILKIRNSFFLRIFILKIAGCYPFLIQYLGTLGGQRNIGNTSENIKCSNLMKK